MKLTITLPVYNEEKIIESNVLRLKDFLSRNLEKGIEYKIIIADNASTDETRAVCQRLSDINENIYYFFTSKKGKGEAIIKSWQAFPADIYSFMDADLATDLRSFPLLIKPLANKEAEIVIGSRFLSSSKVKRSIFRKILSRSYKNILKLFLDMRASDAPCGFKALRAEAAAEILPEIEDREYFFDTELLLRAQKKGLKIIEIPVTWIEPRQRRSKVNSLRLSCQYLKKIWKIKKSL